MTLQDRVQWDEALNQLPVERQDIYFTPEYYQLYEKNGDGKTHCFVFEHNGDLALYPFLMNSINELRLIDLREEFYDIQGVYGYNGVVSSTFREEFVENFYQAFSDYCKNHNIIAEFTRFQPLLDNFKFSQKFMDVIFNRKTVYLDLEMGHAFIWEKSYNAKNRNKIRKAKKCKLTLEFNHQREGYDNFYRIYFETMKNLNADKDYFYNQLYFENLRDLLGEKQKLIEVRHNNETIFSLLLMISKNYAHYHLSGRNKRYSNLAANNYALDAAIRFASDLGCKKFHFGGGTSNADNDPLFTFKSSFSKSTADFYIGKKIHNNKIYKDLVREWEKKFPEKNKIYENLFLKYRIQFK